MASRTAVLIPCYNEAPAIAAVVREFRTQLPDASIYVYDNHSTDRTAEEARRAGAIVRSEPRKGKGYVMRAMFREVDADVYVVVDGDGTYPADRVQALIEPVLRDEADMVVGSRLLAGEQSRLKLINWIGNRALRKLLNISFGVRITDLLSGYRAMNRRVVKCVPVLSRGFEIETELTAKCLEQGYRVLEIPVALSERAVGTSSKLDRIRDGLLIVRTILALARDYKPLTAFGSLGVIVIAVGVAVGLGVVTEYLATGLVPRLPTAVLSVGLVLAGLILTFVGVILHTIARRFQLLDTQLRTLMEHVLSPRG